MARFRAVGEWFDTLGNVMAILAGAADADQTATILDFIRPPPSGPLALRQPGSTRPSGDPEWRDYYGLLNVPGHYHNIGIWPFIDGFTWQRWFMPEDKTKPMRP